MGFGYGVGRADKECEMTYLAPRKSSIYNKTMPIYARFERPRPCFQRPKLHGYSQLALLGAFTSAHYYRSGRPQDTPGAPNFQLSGWESETMDKAPASALATVASGARTLFRAPESALNSNLSSFRPFSDSTLFQMHFVTNQTCSNSF